jgi:transcription-repair coupling factor (superfamily II helicase)
MGSSSLKRWKRSGKRQIFLPLIDEHYEKALTKRRPVLSPGLLYIKDEELFSSVKRFKNVFLQEGPLAPLPCEDDFAFETETNEDLRREMNALFATEKGSAEVSPFSILLRQVLRWKEKRTRIFITSHTPGQAERLRDLLTHYEVVCQLKKDIRFRKALEEPQENITLIIGSLSSGFRNPERDGSFNGGRDLW